MKPSEFVMKELEGKDDSPVKLIKAIVEGIVTELRKNNISFHLYKDIEKFYSACDKLRLIDRKDLLQTLFKLNNKYISVEEQNNKLKGYRSVAKVLVEHEKEIRKLSKFETPRIKKLKEQHEKEIKELREDNRILYDVLKSYDIPALKEYSVCDLESCKHYGISPVKDYCINNHSNWVHIDWTSAMAYIKQQLSKTSEKSKISKVSLRKTIEIEEVIKKWLWAITFWKDNPNKLINEFSKYLKQQKLTKKRKI